jgi:hypothetical protein
MGPQSRRERPDTVRSDRQQPIRSPMALREGSHLASDSRQPTRWLRLPLMLRPRCHPWYNRPRNASARHRRSMGSQQRLLTESGHSLIPREGVMELPSQPLVAGDSQESDVRPRLPLLRRKAAHPWRERPCDSAPRPRQAMGPSERPLSYRGHRRVGSKSHVDLCVRILVAVHDSDQNPQTSRPLPRMSQVVTGPDANLVWGFTRGAESSSHPALALCLALTLTRANRE